MQYSSASWNSQSNGLYVIEGDSSEKEEEPSPLKDRYGDPFSNEEPKSPLLLKPNNLKTNVTIDNGMRTYSIEEKVGDLDYRTPSSMTFQEFAEYQRRQMMLNYWKQNSSGSQGSSTNDDNSIAPPLFQKKNASGQTVVEVRPSGFVNIDLGGIFQRVENPAVAVQQQKVGSFEFDQQIQLNVVGKIGDRLQLTANWDTKAVFDFDNSIKIEYRGKEEDIIQNIEAGNVSLPIKNTLVRGAQNLFGVRADLRFGKLDVTSIVSNQRGSTETITIKGGGQQQSVELAAAEYDEYRHFFLAHYFRDLFDQAYASNPYFPSNGAVINRVEVYITNRNNTVDNLRNFVAINELGENGTSPVTNNTLYDLVTSDPTFRSSDNTSNVLQNNGLASGNDFEVVQSARRLEEGRDFTFNRNLGYISLTSRIGEDEALAVAFEYSVNNTVYKVGELSEDYAEFEQDDVIVLKMIKPQSVRIRPFETWDLMMKNIYQVASGSFSDKNFQLSVVYRDDESGLDNPTLQNVTTNGVRGVNLVQLLNADKFNSNNDLVSDGNWDYLSGITLDESKGRIIFPVVEPFGEHLDGLLNDIDDEFYVFDTLYSSTKNDAQNDAEKNKFFITGRVQTSSRSGISLPGINIAENSVSVVIGGIALTEGSDYTVNYRSGTVNILNDGVLASGRDIVITYEKADLFSFRQKSLVGARFDYHVKENFDVGATVLHLSERPLLSRVNIGEEPIKNTQIGLDLHYQDESRFITKLVDKLPGISTKEPSNIKIDWEGAIFKPGNSKFIGEDGNAYIDDFEGAEISFDMGNSATRWKIGATPKSGVVDSAETGLALGYHRAKLSWYNIDRSFYFDGAAGLQLSEDDAGNFYTGSYNIDDLFTGTDLGNLQNSILTTFDLAFYPEERGPYNYNPLTSPEIDETTGDFDQNIEDNWAAITRAITFDTDFDNANVEFIEFWLLDPFIEENGYGIGNAPSSGNLTFHLGNVSEDVLKDSKHAFENGLPDNVETTDWGLVTTQQFLNNAFDNTVDRSEQDVGLDGLNNAAEQEFFDSLLTDNFSVPLPEKLVNDPSSDDFIHYNDSEVSDDGLLEKYRFFGGVENNSSLETNDNFPLASTTLPDNEDLNADNTLGNVEQYFAYNIELKRSVANDPTTLDLSNPYIVDVQDVGLSSSSGSGEQRWYQFRIPVRQPTDTVNELESFKSIKYIRTVLSGFDKTAILRIAEFQLISAQWREFESSLTIDTLTAAQEPAFTFSTVNANENAGTNGGTNVSPYVSPLAQDVDNSTNQSLTINEQSLKLTVSNLTEGDAKAVFKNLTVDLLNYERIKMFIHAETDNNSDPATPVNAIIRLGTDFENNYYEIEIPLEYTDPSSSSRDAIWPDANELDISISELVRAKLRFQSDKSLDSVMIGKHIVRVKGNPDISSVRVVMLGVKNPIDDGITISDETRLWFNELRASGFVKKAGYATNLAIAMNLADLGTLNANGSILTRGYGDIEQKISERAREDTYNYGFATNLNLDKLLPKKLGLKIPVYASYDKKTIKPQFDPLNPDVELDDAIDFYENDPNDTTGRAERYVEKVIYRETTRSFNITNLRKVKTKEKAKKHIYDIENITLSGGISETKASGLGESELSSGNGIDEYRALNYTGAIKYTYAPKEFYISPLRTSKLFKGKHLQLIRDFNFNPIPSSISLSTDFNRSFTETHYLNDTLGRDSSSSVYQKSFNIYRRYNLNWNLTKSVRTNYSATAFAVIDDNVLNDSLSENNFENNPGRRKSITEFFKTTGRLKNFQQTVGASYRLPLNKIPMLSWISSDIKYNGSYNWTAAPVGLDSLGHTISNKRNISLNGNIRLTNIYNQSKFLKTISSPYVVPRKTSKNKDTPPPKKHTFARIFLRPLLSVRSISGSYSWEYGSAIAGFLPDPELLGLSRDNSNAPGVEYVTGLQELNGFRHEASDWVTSNQNLNQQSTEQISRKLNLKATIEPFNYFSINLNLSHVRSSNFSAILRDTTADGLLDYVSPTTGGNISMSFITIQTAFEKNNSDNSSDAFDNFERFLSEFQELYKNANPDIPYDERSQDVLISSFLTAYTGGTPSNKKLRTVPKIPLPNWRLSYSGLSKIPSLKKKFQTISINHSYSSTYQVGNYSSSLLFTELGPGQDLITQYNDNNFDLTRDGASISDSSFNPAFLIGEVSISERFSPLIGITFRTKKKLSFNFDYTTSRNVSLQVSNAQINEVKTKGLRIGVGYTKAGIKLPFGFKPGVKPILKNDVTFKMDVTVQDTRTVQRSLDSDDGVEGLNTVTGGNLNFQLRPNLSYVVNKRLNLQMYFERTINEPKISSSFRTANTAFGFRLRFSLI